MDRDDLHGYQRYAADFIIEHPQSAILLDCGCGKTVITLTAIEEQMLEAGYSELRVEEAQAVYLLALFDKGDEDQFVERLVGCFEEEQTDAELISAINAEFGTAINHTEFTEAVKEIREKYKNQEENPSG